MTVQSQPLNGEQGDTRCCQRHHYTCAASFDEFPPEPCCPSCPCQRYPLEPLPFGSEPAKENTDGRT
jgi:hypothetical protein